MSLKDEFYALISDKEKEMEEILKDKYINSNLYAVDLSGEALKRYENEWNENDVIVLCNYKITNIEYHYHCRLQFKVEITRIKIIENDIKIYNLEEAFIYCPDSDTDGKIHYTKNKKEIEALVNYLKFSYKLNEQQMNTLVEKLDLL